MKINDDQFQVYLKMSQWPCVRYHPIFADIFTLLERKKRWFAIQFRRMKDVHSKSVINWYRDRIIFEMDCNRHRNILPKVTGTVKQSSPELSTWKDTQEARMIRPSNGLFRSKHLKGQEKIDINCFCLYSNSLHISAFSEGKKWIQLVLIHLFWFSYIFISVKFHL